MSSPFFPLLLLFISPLLGRSEDCGGHNWRRALSQDDFIIYGITQDCQIFFSRSSQLGSLSQIKTDPSNNYCFPNLIQLQLVDNSTLRLLIKQHGNRICVLTINIPPLDILFGPNAFTYSLSSSMPYARCSHAAAPLSLETDLAFADSAYSDVLYFIDPMSSGPRWTARQFMLNENDTLAYLDKFTLHNGDRPDDGVSPPLANEFVLSLDAEKNFLFKRNRFRRSFSYECAFDLLFRPDLVVFKSSFSSIANSSNERSSWLNSLAVDKEVMIFAETDKQSPVAPTRLYVQSTQGGNEHAHCIGQLPYRVELGLVSLRTLEHIAHKPLPKFGLARNAPPLAFRPRPHGSRPATAPPPHTPVVRQQVVANSQTSSRLTQTTSTTTERTTSTTVHPVEPPDESEDLTEADAALYDDLEATASITTTVTEAAASQTWPTSLLHPTTSTSQPNDTPKNETLTAKSSSLYFALISAIATLLALLSQ